LGNEGMQHRSFLAECEALRNARHRNIVKIITLCSSVDPIGADFKAIVFPYMLNGNLDMWLNQRAHQHNQRKILTLSQRINVALDLANAMDYLHNQCASPIIHCDLKPSNILLDHEMVAYVSDFGLARFQCTKSSINKDSSATLASLKGSIGYIPPGEFIFILSFPFLFVLYRIEQKVISFHEFHETCRYMCRVWHEPRHINHG